MFNKEDGLIDLATLYPKGRFRPTQIRTPTARKERSYTDEIRE
jgi:hypothetical protein